MRLTSLDPCVHCGFCLPACPTYLLTGDESESPRGRIVLMQGLEEETLTYADSTVRHHLDTCLACVGCEPACPSGVQYGVAISQVRTELAHRNGINRWTRLALAVLGRDGLRRPFLALARAFRGLPLVPGPPILRRLQAQLRATRSTHQRRQRDLVPPGSRGRVGLLHGCVMEGLFDHIHAATRRVLLVNGFEVHDLQTGCCGALHEHAGDHEGACQRAAHQAREIQKDQLDAIVVNSAGCGAMLKSYRDLLGDPSGKNIAERTHDVAELLAKAGPVQGAPLARRIAYDPPCHLQHAQGVHEAVLTVLSAIPGLAVEQLPGADQCCGGAGLYGVVHPEKSSAILARKIAEFQRADPPIEAVVTGNPGCIMQIGGGILLAGMPLQVRHPVELLDESYAQAGFYQSH